MPYPQMLHVWYIYLYLAWIYGKLVGKYAVRPMGKPSWVHGWYGSVRYGKHRSLHLNRLQHHVALWELQRQIDLCVFFWFQFQPIFFGKKTMGPKKTSKKTYTSIKRPEVERYSSWILETRNAAHQNKHTPLTSVMDVRCVRHCWYHLGRDLDIPHLWHLLPWVIWHLLGPCKLQRQRPKTMGVGSLYKHRYSKCMVVYKLPTFLGSLGGQNVGNTHHRFGVFRNVYRICHIIFSSCSPCWCMAICCLHWSTLEELDFAPCME